MNILAAYLGYLKTTACTKFNILRCVESIRTSMNDLIIYCQINSISTYMDNSRNTSEYFNYIPENEPQDSYFSTVIKSYPNRRVTAKVNYNFDTLEP